MSSTESSTIRPTPTSRANRKLLIGLDIAVQQHPLRREARRDRERHLTAGTYVQRQARLGGQPNERLRQQRLARVGDLRRRQRGAVGQHPGTDLLGVENIERRSEAAGEIRQLDATDSKPTRAAGLGGIRPDAAFQPRITSGS